MPERIAVANDEIEVACDLLWYVKLNGAPTPVAEALWARLQPIRHGDYGGTATTELTPEEAGAVVNAGDFTHPRVELDEDETELVARLRSLLG